MKTWMKTLSAAILCLLGSWAVMNRPDAGRWTGRPEDMGSPATAGPQPTVALVAATPTPSQPVERLMLTTLYAQCGHSVTRVLTPDGSSFETLCRQYAGWEGSQYQNIAIFRRSVATCCPQHIYVRYSQGQIEVRGDPDGQGIRELTRLEPPESISPLALDELAGGLEFSSMEDLESYLESMGS